MTYVPVNPEERKSNAGRNPLDIPEALLAQLRHSKATGAKCQIELSPDDNPDDLAELRRAIIRAGYRHFSEYTIRRRKTATTFTYWVEPKAAGRKKRGKK